LTLNLYHAKIIIAAITTIVPSTPPITPPTRRGEGEEVDIEMDFVNTDDCGVVEEPPVIVGRDEADEPSIEVLGFYVSHMLGRSQQNYWK